MYIIMIVEDLATFEPHDFHAVLLESNLVLWAYYDTIMCNNSLIMDQSYS